MKSQLYAFGLIVSALGTAQAAPAVVAKTAEPLAEIAPLPEQNGLKISIAPTSRNGNQTPTIALHRGDPHINVVLQNTSSKPIQIFQEWNGWGYDNLVLEVTAVDGKTLNKPILVSRGMMIWDANPRTTDSLDAGSALVREVQLHLPPQIFDPATSSTDRELNRFGPLYWGFPFPPPNNSRSVTMSAVFANDDDNAAVKAGAVWTGRIASPPQKYQIVWRSD